MFDMRPARRIVALQSTVDEAIDEIEKFRSTFEIVGCRRRAESNEHKRNSMMRAASSAPHFGVRIADGDHDICDVSRRRL